MRNQESHPLKAIRQNCLDCSETVKYITYCPCDGLHSTLCALWPFRFGKRPATVRKKWRALMTPDLMPDASVPVEDLPKNPADWCRKVEGRSVDALEPVS